MGKTTPPKPGVSGKKGKKRGNYPRTKKHREDMSRKVSKARAGKPPTPAQQEASRQNALLGGRPSEYRPELCDEIVTFFAVEDTRTMEETYTDKKGNVVTKQVERGNKLPTLEAFACAIGVSMSTIYAWQKAHPEFKEAVERAQAHQHRILISNGLLGHYAQPFALLFAKTNMGYSDRVALQGGGEDAPPIQQEVALKDEAAKRREAYLKRMEAVLARLEGKPA